MKKFFFAVSLAFLFLLPTACKRSASSTLSYDPTDATVSAFAFANIDSMPGLKAAKFIVENLSDTGRIGMADGDSILFGTSLKKVIPTLRYNGLPSAAICYLGDTSVVLTGYDTLDFTLTPILLRVFAADRKNEKWYRVEPRIHKVDPDVYTWNCLNEAILPPESAEQHAFYDGRQFMFYTNNGQQTMLAVSDDGADWQAQTVSGLPAQCHVKQICCDSIQHRYYYLDAACCYSSADGITWSSAAYTNSDVRCLAGVMVFCRQLWAVVYQPSLDTYSLATYNEEFSSFDLHRTFTETDFPVSDFSVVQFTDAHSRSYALVAGGYLQNGDMTGHSWAFEETTDGCRVVRLHDNNKSVDSFAGRAIAWYGKRLIAFGGMNADNEWQVTPLVSDNEGVSWEEYTDTLHPVLPADYAERRRISVITKDNDLYLIGGQSVADFHTDVYKGRLASIDW